MVAWLQSVPPAVYTQNLNGYETKTTGTGKALKTKTHCALRCTMLACNHTDGVHDGLLWRILCLLFSASAPHQQQGAFPAPCFILRHLCFSFGNHILAGTQHNWIMEVEQ